MIIDNKVLERDILPQAEKPGQYVGGELNCCCKKWNEAPVRLAFAFPDTYEVGMSHLGLRLLYEVVNHHTPHLCERVFMPQPDMRRLLTQYDVPLFTLESRHELRDFDLVGFTLQYELSYTNMLAMLDLAHIPLMAAVRGEDDPLVIAGGPCAYNPEPLADIIDLFAIGEGEEVLPELLDLIAEAKRAGWSRGELLYRAAQLTGVYVPSLYTPHYDEQGRFAGLYAQDGAPAVVRKRIVADFDNAVSPSRPLLPLVKPIHDRVMLEVMRGCTRGCRFCQAGTTYRPVREKSPATLRLQAKDQIDHSGYDDIALLSLSTADYSGVEALMCGLLDDHAADGVSVSLPSLRVDAFSVGLAARTQEVRKSGITLAPEAGSQRMRDTINKGVCEEDIIAAVTAAFSQGYSRIKLYFMLGLPYESNSDIEAIAELCRRVVQIGRREKPAEVKKPLQISLGVASFVPKSHTPFQWQGQNSDELLQHKQDLLREKIRPLRQVTVSFHDRAASLLEAAFARGDRRLGAVLLEAYSRGCCLDGWKEHFRPELWQAAFAACGLSAQDYAEREYIYGQPLPWSHIDCGVSEQWLWRENIRAGRAELTQDCRSGECSGCGVCGDSVQNSFATVESRETEPTQRRRQPVEQQYKYRCRLSVQGGAAWLSHLDLLVMLEKTLRRAKLPLAFSQGFNPHLLLSWGPAHPVGLYSDCEYVDLIFSAMPPEDWQQRLNEVMPDGLRLLQTRLIDLHSTALMASVNRADYRIDLHGTNEQELNAAVNKFLAAERVELERVSPKGRKTVDVRPSVESLRAEEESVYVSLRLDRGAAVKMTELARLLAPGASIEKMMRTGLFVGENMP